MLPEALLVYGAGCERLRASEKDAVSELVQHQCEGFLTEG